MAQQLISFAELTGGTETVRYTPLKDGKTYMHVYVEMVPLKRMCAAGGEMAPSGT